MPNTTTTWQLKAAVNSCGSLMARVYGADGALINQSGFNSATTPVTVYVRRLDKTGNLSTYTPAYAATIFNSLQTDGRWSKDVTGYNFRWDYAATVFPVAGRYGLTIRFTDDDGNSYNGVEAEVTVDKSRAG